MGIKTTFVCDNCKAESSVPEKWFRLAPFETERDSGISILPFRVEEAKRTKSFCGEACTLHYISTQLFKLHKAEEIVKKVNSPLPEATEEVSKYAKNLKEFLDGKQLNS